MFTGFTLHMSQFASTPAAVAHHASWSRAFLYCGMNWLFNSLVSGAVLFIAATLQCARHAAGSAWAALLRWRALAAAPHEGAAAAAGSPGSSAAACHKRVRLLPPLLAGLGFFLVVFVGLNVEMQVRWRDSLCSSRSSTAGTALSDEGSQRGRGQCCTAAVVCPLKACCHLRSHAAAVVTDAHSAIQGQPGPTRTSGGGHLSCRTSQPADRGLHRPVFCRGELPFFRVDDHRLHRGGLRGLRLRGPVAASCSGGGGRRACSREVVG